ncbi:secondary carrier transporter [Lithospermum erythrorhizon]|uniref:Secondary carrier transporter n=1 Tax=Lithospermum erythrorhizon TaxID=34254 RepID=A0AAV3R2D8_LITER
MAELSNGFTVDEALSSMGFGNFHVLGLFFAGLGWASSAMALTLLSIILPSVKSEWRLSANEESMITTVVFAGTLVGAYFFGYLSDVYGRRTSIICSVICSGGAVSLAGVSRTYASLLVVIYLFGFGAGGGHVFASWFLEFAPISTRGSATAALSLFYSFGNIVAASLAWMIMPRLGWRWLVSSSCLPPLFVLLLGLIVPESPRYLIMKGKITDAQKVLEKVARFNRTEVPRGSLISSQLTAKDEEHASLELEENSLLLAGKKKDGGSESRLSSVFLLFSPKLLRTTFLLWLVYFGNVFAYYGIIFLTSQMSSGQNSCMSSTVVNNDKNATSYGEILLNSLAEVPSALLAAGIVDWAGRKLSLVMTSTLSFILLVPLVCHQSKTVTTALLFGARLFITTGTMVLAVYSSEVYPTSLRSTGVGIATAVGTIGGMVCPLVAVVLIEGCHQGPAIGLFEAVLVLIGVAVVLLPLETKGKTLNDSIPNDEELSEL